MWLAHLEHSQVARGGARGDDWIIEGLSSITCKTGGGIFRSAGPSALSHSPSISLQTTIPSKGGGKTKIAIEISAEDFPALAAVMMSADKRSVMKAFGAALIEAATDKDDVEEEG